MNQLEGLPLGCTPPLRKTLPLEQNATPGADLPSSNFKIGKLNTPTSWVLIVDRPYECLSLYNPWSYQSIGQLWSDYLINKMIRLSSLISLSYNHISKMQHFIKILMRKADHFLKYFFPYQYISEKNVYDRYYYNLRWYKKWWVSIWLI